MLNLSPLRPAYSSVHFGCSTRSGEATNQAHSQSSHHVTPNDQVRFGTAKASYGIKNPEVRKAIESNDGAALIALDNQGQLFGPKDKGFYDSGILTFLLEQQGFSKYEGNDDGTKFKLPKLVAFDPHWDIYLYKKADTAALQKEFKNDVKQDVLIALALIYAKRDRQYEYKLPIPTEKWHQAQYWVRGDYSRTIHDTKNMDVNLETIKNIDPDNFYKKIAEYAPQIPDALLHASTRVVSGNVLHMAIDDDQPDSTLNKLIEVEPRLVYESYWSTQDAMMQHALMYRKPKAFKFFFDYAVKHKGEAEAKKMLRQENYRYIGCYPAVKPVLHQLLNDYTHRGANPETLTTIRALLEADPTLVLEKPEEIAKEADAGDYWHSRVLGKSDMRIVWSADKPENRPPFSERMSLLREFAEKALAAQQDSK